MTGKVSDKKTSTVSLHDNSERERERTDYSLLPSLSTLRSPAPQTSPVIRTLQRSSTIEKGVAYPLRCGKAVQVLSGREKWAYVL